MKDSSKEDEKNGMYERTAEKITLQKCKDQVAIRLGHANWHIAEYRMSRDDMDRLHDEAAELYSTQKLEEYRSLSKVERVEQDLSEKETSFYKLIAPLVTTYQMSPEDWNLGPMSKRNWKAISRQIDTHNDRLKELAIQLKNKFEALTRRSSTVESKSEGWISVTDGIYPSRGDADEKGNVLGWDRMQNEVHKCKWHDICQMRLRFTHWQPLPKAPVQKVNTL